MDIVYVQIAFKELIILVSVAVVFEHKWVLLTQTVVLVIK